MHHHKIRLSDRAGLPGSPADSEIAELPADFFCNLAPCGPLLSGSCKPQPLAETLTSSSAVFPHYDDGASQRVLEKLETLLKQGDPACLNLIKDLRRIPGSWELIREMEDFYFGIALVILENLKKDTGTGDTLWTARERTVC